MAKYLIIAGHGTRANGTFDPGARGIVGGEHRYMVDKLFPAMRKYANKDFIFYTRRNVFSHGDLVSLARSYGANTKVVEVHYDAFNGNARGGHVIIHTNYAPDAMDIRLRDAINSMVGLRFTHKGYRGISGRSNLGNVNRAYSGNINYRMLELGFGDNPTDANIMLTRVDEYAKKLVEAISGQAVTSSGGYQTATGGTSTSGGYVVSYMDSKGMDSSFTNRAALASQYGITDFTGSASQNLELLGILKGDIKPRLSVGWIQDDIGWWYRESNGLYPIEEWKQIGGTWYYFENTGYMATGWKEVSDVWYYLDSSGAMQTGWVEVGKYWYYMDSSGAMQTGWNKLHGNWYFMNEHGLMLTGWVLDNNLNWYYMDSNGVMQTGLIKVKGSDFFLKEDGALAENEIVKLQAAKGGYLN